MPILILIWRISISKNISIGTSIPTAMSFVPECWGFMTLFLFLTECSIPKSNKSFCWTIRDSDASDHHCAIDSEILTQVSSSQVPTANLSSHLKLLNSKSNIRDIWNIYFTPGKMSCQRQHKSSKDISRILSLQKD